MPTLVCLSDTHGLHAGLTVPEGDILVYAGDWSSFRGSEAETIDFLRWLNALPHPHKVLIAGNHDLPAQAPSFPEMLTLHAPKVDYLADLGVTVMGLRIWGSPRSLIAGHKCCAFAKDRHAICEYWDLIPSDTDILVTHGGAYGYLDGVEMVYHWGPTPTVVKEPIGCRSLATTLDRLTRLRLMVCGHVHGEGAKVLGLNRPERTSLTIVNACMVNEAYELVNRPVVVTLP